MKKIYPSTLVVSINAWRDTSGINTLLNLFKGWDPSKLSQIYTKSDLPQTTACNDFFQIPEQSVVRSTYHWKQQIGRRITQQDDLINDPTHKALHSSEQKNLSFVRGHRSIIFTLLRELIWSLGTWKNRELKSYLDEARWDVVFCPIYPLIFMNKLQAFVLKRTGLKGVAFIGDDNYTYKTGERNPLHFLHRYFLRHSIRRVISGCQEVFVMTPKMKDEYDAIFKVNSKLLTKGIEFSNDEPTFQSPSKPIQIIYAGKLIIGRYKSLAAIARTLQRANQNGKKAELHIYTQDEITPSLRKELEIPDCSFLHTAVPYPRLQEVLRKADVVVFVESLEKPYRQLARLSFSTKITDYFKAAKCILAVGAEDIAPIEYLRDKDAAIVCSSYQEIDTQITWILENPEIIRRYAQAAYNCGKMYHNAKDTIHKIYDTLNSVASCR